MVQPTRQTTDLGEGKYMNSRLKFVYYDNDKIAKWWSGLMIKSLIFTWNWIQQKKLITENIIQVWHLGECNINFYGTLKNDIARGGAISFFRVQ